MAKVKTIAKTVDVLYRYNIQYSNYDDGDTNLDLREYKVLEETEKTWLIKWDWWRKKRIRKESYDKFAHPTKEKALKHFIRRTYTRIRWYEYWIEECKKAVDIAIRLQEKQSDENN